jgi:glycosyltransferase involved in cell wall biosynthesis
MVAMCRLLGGPTYSLTLHGDLPVYGTDHAAKMAGAACIGCDGPHLVQQIVEQGRVAPEKILPNWMGVDTHRFEPRENGDAMPKRLHLVTVARLDACKGHRHAIAAVRTAVDRGYDIRYTLAGAGPNREALEQQVGQLGLADRVTLLGSRAETEVIELLRDADAFALPSVGLGEAGPISLMEAMAAGLPAVSSIIGAVPNMLTDGVEGFLIAQRDEAGLASAFMRLADDPDLRHRMGTAARARAVAEFEVENTTRRLLEFIERHTGKRFRAAIHTGPLLA